MRIRLLPVVLLCSCFEGDCPEGFLRDNSGNCIQVGDDDGSTDDDDDNGSSDILALGLNVTCTLSGDQVPWVVEVDVYDEDSGSRAASSNTNGDGEVCLDVLQEGHSYRVELFDPGTGDCIMAFWGVDADLSNGNVLSDCPCSGECPGTVRLGTCNEWDTYDDCWGS